VQSESGDESDETARWRKKRLRKSRLRVWNGDEGEGKEENGGATGER
jgi:hypothetical protein